MPASTIPSIHAVGVRKRREHCGLSYPRLFGGGTRLDPGVRRGVQEQRLGFSQRPVSGEAAG